ncbi:MAG: endolytic transglycosylase MltG [Zoogloea sp.]|nr:endolytic transglycosylase MltG [Zoogloea sp.]
MMRLLLRLTAVFALCLVTLAGWLAWYVSQPVALSASPLDFTISQGSSMKQVARQLSDAGIGAPPLVMTWLARLTRQDSAVKAGSYEVEEGVTMLGLLSKLTRGDMSQGELAVIEGWNFRQMRAAMDAQPDLRHDSAGLSDAEIMRRIGATEKHPEGLFYPDTYLFAKQSSDLDVLRRAYREMKVQLAAQWEQRNRNTPYETPYQALVMASIIEKETGLAADRPAIASVFINRLRNGMLLQTDPTVIYGLGTSFDGNLRKHHLQADTPYNTYTRTGLPPTPISMPGLAALRAALNPPRTEYLYFVARGDGSSEFSRSLDEHNRAVARYQKRRNT